MSVLHMQNAYGMYCVIWFDNPNWSTRFFIRKSSRVLSFCTPTQTYPCHPLHCRHESASWCPSAGLSWGHLLSGLSTMLLGLMHAMGTSGWDIAGSLCPPQWWEGCLNLSDNQEWAYPKPMLIQSVTLKQKSHIKVLCGCFHLHLKWTAKSCLIQFQSKLNLYHLNSKWEDNVHLDM